MKRAVILSLLVMLMLNFDLSLYAQSVKRIQFAKGRTSATVKGNTGSYGVNYVIRARAGQKLVLTLTPTRNVAITVDRGGRYEPNPLLNEERGGTFVVGLEESGEYTIHLNSTENRPTAFTLTVKIATMTDI